MDRTGVVVSLEKVGAQTSVIFRCSMDIREGQHVRLGPHVWTVVKKNWVRRPVVSLVLNLVPTPGFKPSHPVNGQPSVDDSLEIMFDRESGDPPVEAMADLKVETVVSFERTTLLCARGALPAEPGDVLTDGTGSWKILDQTDGVPSAPGKKWFSIKAVQGTAGNPVPNSQLLKRD